MKKRVPVIFWIQLILITVFYVIIGRLPLLKEVHFDYAWLAGLLTYIVAGTAQCVGYSSIAWASLLSPVAAVPVLILINGPCDPAKSLLLTSSFAASSFILANPAAGWTKSITEGRCKRVLLFIFVTAILIIPSLARIYLGPGVYAYNIVFKYWPGAIYDEYVNLSARFWLLGISSEILLGTVLYIITKAHTHLTMGPGKKWTQLFGLVALSCAAYIEFYPPFCSTSKVIKEKLSRTLKAGSVSLYTSIDDKKRLKFLQREIKWYDFSIRTKLGLSPLPGTSIYLYKSEDERAKLAGLRKTSLGHPIARAVHYVPDWPENPLLRHEMVHVYAVSKGRLPFYMCRHVAVTEGLAESIFPYKGRYTLHEISAAILAHKNIDLEKFATGTGFWRQSAVTAYPLAGSFVSYLLETYGKDRFYRLYKSGDFAKSLGNSLKNILEGWKNFLKDKRLPPLNEKNLEYLWKTGSIFERRCPRTTAELRYRAWRNPDSTEILLKKAFIISNRALGPFFDLMYFYSSKGKTNTLSKLCSNPPSSLSYSAQKRVELIKAALNADENNLNEIKMRVSKIVDPLSFPDIARLSAIESGNTELFKALTLPLSAKKAASMSEAAMSNKYVPYEACVRVAELFLKAGEPTKAFNIVKSTVFPPHIKQTVRFHALKALFLSQYFAGKTREALNSLSTGEISALPAGWHAYLKEWKQRLERELSENWTEKLQM